MFKKRTFKFTLILPVFLILVVLAVGLLIERNGISYYSDTSDSYYLSDNQVKTKAEALANVSATNLLIYDSSNETSASAIDNFKQIFEDMKVATTYVDIANETVPDFTTFDTVVILTPDLEPLGEVALRLMEWVESGGNVMFAMTLQKDDVVSIIEHKLGVVNSSYTYAEVAEVSIKNGFMLGAGQDYNIDEPFESAWAVELDDNAEVYLTTGDDSKIPLVWEYDLGSGRVVVDNFGIYVKAMRGFYSASYSLLGDVGVYPVINSAAFTLDDFPSPVPSGDAKYITRDYQMTVSDFYTNVWWPNMVSLADKYGIKYTGVIIENYEDDTTGSTERQSDSSRFTYFGNMLLQMGGEIGYHGYNHQPLMLSDTDYGDAFSYNTWTSDTAIEKSLDELMDFTENLFPTSEHSVYVSPSNILSAESRALLAKDYPNIKVIASNYFSEEFVYEQEFEVADDGVIEEPRITSGAIIDDYTKLTMVSELNMHYVSHHFVHPDDPLDIDRGAKLGWAQLYKNLSKQMSWLYKTAPSIRNMTESQMGGAIQRFSSITVEKEETDDSYQFNLGNFVDEAYLMVRFNSNKPGDVTGGSLEHLTGNLYLLHATSSTVTIAKK
ncbi:DUF2194 domain-containing protein [Streptococcus gallolyticus subsp. gallolyticus]|uniref:DUF2194 domain-containing protein n=1 Tax=Streptococcus gallolyticus TaxID=315405 RepID=UPI002284F93E|nr:DUF2194 domain-containing protein [Streptococcus gallolyticus]MCY7178478.1 DUF2194 domain-containing protein [Streptococcus gallolyticus subsp. gallolyticus]